jgi:hypothetical protein
MDAAFFYGLRHNSLLDLTPTFFVFSTVEFCMEYVTLYGMSGA